MADAGLDMPHEAGQRPSADRDQARRFLTFAVGPDLYALPAGEVREIIRPPHLSRVPESPQSLLGLANLRGAVLPVVSMRGLLQRGDAAPETDRETVRVVVLDQAAAVGLLVDRVAELVTLDADRIETAEAELAAEPGEILRGAFEAPGREGVVKIIDIGALLAAQFAHLNRRKTAAALAPTARAAAPQGEAEAHDELVLVSFELAGQDYALALERVREIVPLPDAISVVPRADSAMLGVVTLRDQLLPLVSLRALLGLAVGQAPDAQRKVVVTWLGDAPVGLVTDRVKSILRVDASCVDAVPSVLMRGGGEARLQAICRLDSGRRLVSVLSPDFLFRETVARRTGTDQDRGDAMASSNARAGGGEEQFIVFALGEEEYGLPVTAVDEVAPLPKDLTRLPKTPPFVEGVMNLRGAVVPVIDQRRRFGLPELKRHDRQRVIVLTIEGRRAGFIVDRVSELLKIRVEAIGPAPEITDEQVRLISRVANLDASGRMILLLDAKELLDRTERGLLSAMAEIEAPQAVS